MTDYQEFLKKKLITTMPTGFDPASMPEHLYPYQSDLATWACKRGKAALFTMTGTGKTFMQSAWADSVQSETSGNVLLLAPLAVAKQTVREAKKIGININYCRHDQEVKRGINITNYEMLHHFEQCDWSGIVLDECFPPKTPIDVFSIDNVLTCKYIKDIRKGDKIYNASGVDHVQNIYKRRINRAVKISIDGHNITCSENHPWFTMHGWRSGQDLRTGDYVMATSEAVRMVRDGILPSACSSENGEVLRSILLSEMAHEYTGSQVEGTYARNSGEKGSVTFQMVEEWKPKSDSGNGKDNKSQSYEQPGNQVETEIDIAEDGAQTFRAWGQWSSDDITAAINDGCIIRKLDTGITYITGKTSSRFSDMLQSRLRQSRLENSDRNRRAHTPKHKRQGLEEGCKTGFFRVDSVEILELGHPDMDQYRDENGDIYFYDIKATRHPSFSVYGCLVHNSSILKSFNGKTRNQIIEYSNRIPYRLACTATPAPNDFMELGNHAEFLGIMSFTEMLATFFVHDGGDTAKWRLKGHAEQKFWEWMASWGVFLTKPSDLGYSDEGFELPALNTYQHIVESEATEGALFAFEAKGLQERQAARRESIQRRCEKAAEIVEHHRNDGPFMLWCDLNSESEMLTKMIPGAVEVKGSDSADHKESSMLDFADGNIPVMISKPSICGFGLNFQACHNTAFVGLSDSFEAVFQATKRFHRHGQKHEVNRHLIISEAEGSVLQNIQRKESEFMQMIGEMVKHTAKINMDNIKKTHSEKIEYSPNMPIIIPDFLYE